MSLLRARRLAGAQRFGFAAPTEFAFWAFMLEPLSNYFLSLTSLQPLSCLLLLHSLRLVFSQMRPRVISFYTATEGSALALGADASLCCVKDPAGNGFARGLGNMAPALRLDAALADTRT